MTTTSSGYFTRRMTPPEVARMLGVNAAKVLIWIHKGELAAIDVSTRRGGRPRWRVRADDLQRFEQARCNRPMPTTPRVKRKGRDEIKSYF